MSARDGKDKAASPFRQESLDRAKSPEQLDDYIRVSNPGVWMVLGAVLLLLLAGFIWACCGRLVDTMPTALVVQGGHATCYVAEDEVGQVAVGDTVSADSVKGAVASVGNHAPLSRRTGRAAGRVRSAQGERNELDVSRRRDHRPARRRVRCPCGHKRVRSHQPDSGGRIVMLPGKGARRARTAGKPGQMAGKVPVIMQMEALECGAACLAMIAAYYGKWVPLEQVRADCGVSRDGSKASNVVRAARAYGFEASGFRMQPEALRSQGVFPCIVHWNFSHFVVCRGFKGGKVHLNDPARGEVTVTEEEFDAAFTGVMLRFVPGPDFQPSGKPRSVWEFVGPRLQGSRAALAFVAITAAVTAVVGIINPALSQVFMDRLLGGKNPEWLYPFIALR